MICIRNAKVEDVSHLVELLKQMGPKYVKLSLSHPVKLVKTSDSEWAIIVPRINEENAKIIDDYFFDKKSRCIDK